MKKWRTWSIVAAAALVLAAVIGYWAHTTQQRDEWHEIWLPLSLRARVRMADYYVDNSAPCPGLGTLANPWCDFSQINTLVAGDTLHIRGGAAAHQVYDEPEINITVSGTAANPITVQPYSSEMVELRSPAAQYIFDIHGDWVVINGKATTQFYLNKHNRSGAGAVYVRDTASDCTVQYCEIANVRWAGAMVRSRGDRATFAYNDIHTGYNGPADDCPGIQIQDGDDVIIEYNNIYNVHGDCVNVDDTPPAAQTTIIRYNTLWTSLGECAENGIDVKAGGTAGSPSLIYGNTLYGFRSCTATCGGSGNNRGEAIGIRNDADYVTAYDNEIYDSSTAFVIDDNVRGVILRRNVIHDMANEADDPHADSLSAFWIRARNADIYHNTVDSAQISVYVYSAVDVVIENNIFHDCGNVTGAALPGYSADYNLWEGCTQTLPGAHDVTGQDPRFVDAAGNNYRLQDNSPAIDRGRDIGLSFNGAAPDLGAYEWEESPPVPPVLPPPPSAVGGGAAEYQVWLQDWDGDRIAVFTGTGRETGGLLSFSFLKLLRKPGQYVLRIDGTDERINDFTLDFQVEFWRRDRFGDLDWYKVFEAFHRAEGKRFAESGQRLYESRGDHYNVLLLAEPIFYAAGSTYATKSGPAETVAKAYVNENIGPAATSPPRDYAGVMPGLTIEADGATGASWPSSGRARRNLLDVLVELAEYAPADFMIDGTGAATFEFRWAPDQWGDDKTWGNAGGLPAVSFDARLNNLRNLSYDYDRKNEINICHVLGQGSGEDRRVVTRTSGAESDSPWNARAVCRDARNTYETAALNRKGDEVLDKMRARVQTTVDVAQTVATRFGRDWDIGDLVTVRDTAFDFEATQKIVGVRVDLANDGTENIQAIMEDP